MAQSLLQTSLNEDANLLVVGSGTGMELHNYAGQNSSWKITGVEPSAEMMAIAKSSLKHQDWQDRVSLHHGYIDSLPETELMDGATLLLVMHFLKDDGSKLQLLKDIARRLKPEAKLILADLYGDRSKPYFSQFVKAWQSLYFSRLDDLARARAEANFAISIDNSIFFVTESRIIELLQLAGFRQVNKFYNAFLFGGWIAEYAGN